MQLGQSRRTVTHSPTPLTAVPIATLPAALSPTALQPGEIEDYQSTGSLDSSFIARCLAAHTTVPSSRGGDSRGRTVTSKGKQKSKLKSIDWSEEETKELIYAYGERYEKLKRSSTKERARLWNDIFLAFQRNTEGGNGRTLQQVKKRQQNLEYEFRRIYTKATSTGEEGMLRLKKNFPYFDLMDSFLGHRDSVNPENMEIESSIIFRPISPASASSTSVSSPTPASESDEQEKPTDENSESPPTDTASTSSTLSEKTGGKSIQRQKRGRKRKLESGDQTAGFQQMWEKSLQQDNERFKKCMDMMQESQKLQMEQTDKMMSGFKELFKELVKQ